MLSAVALAVLLVWIEKLVYGNIKQGDELIKGVEAEMLAPVLNVHDGARGAIHKLGKIFLRPAFGFSLVFNLPTQGVEVKAFVILVHSHITPISFYISG